MHAWGGAGRSVGCCVPVGIDDSDTGEVAVRCLGVFATLRVEGGGWERRASREIGWAGRQETMAGVSDIAHVFG